MKTVVRGAARLELATGDARRIKFNIITMGCMVMIGDTLEKADVVFSGVGNHKVRCNVQGSSLFVVPFEDNAPTFLDVPELRAVDVQWLNEPSLTDLEPRPYGAISPEVKAIMDQMNRNAIIREQAMLRALGHRTQ